MTIGDKSTFAIESEISQSYARLSFRAIGYFVLHINGIRYGVCAPDATLLACSFDEVQRRIADRGKHVAIFSNEPDPGKVADAFRDTVYAPKRQNIQYFGIPQTGFEAVIQANHIIWAPDGDQAFDDGSYVLQFDIANRVRLIAFKVLEDRGCYDPLTLTDISLESGLFYNILKRWLTAFDVEWASKPKLLD